MYFPIGWPKYLSVGQGKKSILKHITCNRYRMLFAVLTETTISIWHCKPCVEIVCYQRCHSSVASVGTNELAEWRQDSSMLAVTTTGGYLLLYQLEQDVKGDKGVNLYEYHQIKTNQGDSSEAVPALRLSLKANVNYKGPITSLSSVHDDLLITLKDGRLEILSWDSPSVKRKSIGLCDILFSVDMQLAGLHLKAKHVYPVQAVYSPFLEGFAMVLSDGRASLVAMSQSNSKDFENDLDQIYSDSFDLNAKGIWAPNLSHATCVAVNNKYRLLAFGTKNGDCAVYAIDDVTGCLVLSHTIALSPTYYPNMCNSVGSVLKIEWSPDGCALSLSWTGGGLSIWSVFGACLVCTLASDRAYASDGTPNIQGIFKSMCWGVEGYHLWLISETSSPSTTEKETNQEDAASNSLPDIQIKPSEKKNNKFFNKPQKSSTNNSLLDLGQLLQIHFVKSALAMNPCMSNHCHVLMHGEDRIYLSCGERRLKSLHVPSPEKLNSIKKKVSTPRIPSHNNIFQHKGNISPRRKSVPLPSPTSPVSPTFLLNEKLSPISEDGVSEEPAVEDYESSAVGNKQWTVIQFPLNYVPTNWPIRFAAVDESCCFIAIAGNFGLAHYTVISRKWKVFGNVMQEKDMVVTGGLTWWKDFVVVACYNLSENQDEIRLYPRLTNLDNAFACIKKVKSQILLVNVFQNLLIVYTYDFRISIFVVSSETKLDRPVASLRFLQEISMARFVPYPTLVASVTMSALHMESAVRRSSSSTSMPSRPQRETEVIIVNVAGRLLLLQRSLEEEDTLGAASDESVNTTDDKWTEMRFTSPVVLATCVENVWTTSHKNRAKIHLTDALWLGCGSAGVRVWLPLFPPRQNRHTSSDGTNPRGFELQLLAARRITLAFGLDSCYPLAVLFNEAVILGVTSEMLLYQGLDQNQRDKKSSSKVSSSFPFSTIERTCEIYLHQILRQLLRRNLGYHALQLAATCKNISCFPHVLELMLHEVLEEEATASEPIPDPLLPTVIKFLEEFPEYLQTVVHCARKTEIALWEYLFNSVGSPRELFEECLQTNQLRTAASYLIILQNLEQLSVARQDATRLFDQALQNHMWELANDIARFLRAIGDGDASATPRHPTLLNTNIYPAVSPSSLHNTPTEPESSFKFSSSVMQGSIPASQDEFASTSTHSSTRRLTSRSYTESYLLPSKPPPSSSNTTAVQSTSGSISQSFIPRYSVRQYHQEHPAHRPLQHSLSHPLGSASVRSKRFSGEKDTLHSKEHAAAECAEHYFIDVILARQARKMLAEQQLHKLGTFAAYVDFQLVPWLRKERNRAARVEDPVTCFKALHADFDWPYPSLFISKTNRSLNNAGESPSHSHSHSCGDLNALERDSLSLPTSQSTNFTSGRASPNPRFLGVKSPTNQSMSPHRTSALLDSNGFGADDDAGSGVITMLKVKDRSSTLTLTTAASEVSEMSETSYAFDESSFCATTDDVHGCMTSGFEMDDRRGSARSEMKLQNFLITGYIRYLLELFLEALCLEWAALICIMLKDPEYMGRLLRSSKSEWSNEMVSLETLQRTRECLQEIDQWAVTECSGYKGVLINNRKHVNALYDVITAREVAHAEEQAIIANHQRSSSFSASQTSGSNLSSTELRPAKATQANTSTPSQIPLRPSGNTAKKRLFAPGTAVAQSELKKPIVNGLVSSTTSSDAENCDADTSQTSNPKHKRQPRTRHNSVPCRNNSSTPPPDVVHTRTPSSPAKINLLKQKSDSSPPVNKEEKTNNPPPSSSSPLNKRNNDNKEEPSSVASNSFSDHSEDDRTVSSGSSNDAEDEEESGCIIS